MMNSIPELYAQLKNLTASMLVAAESEKWDELVALEGTRKKLIPDQRLVAANELDEQALAQVVECINYMLETDKRISALSRNWMQEITTIVSSVQNERRLSDTYR